MRRRTGVGREEVALDAVSRICEFFRRRGPAEDVASPLRTAAQGLSTEGVMATQKASAEAR